MYVYSITSPYRHLSIMDSSFGPRNAKNHTSLPVYNMDTSVVDTWFCPFGVRIKEMWLYAPRLNYKIHALFCMLRR